MFLSWWWRAKKKILGVFKGSFETYTGYHKKFKNLRRPLAIKLGATRSLFETYTRYSGVDDEEPKKRS